MFIAKGCVCHVYNYIMKTLKMINVYKFIHMERWPILTANKIHKTV